VKESEAAKKLGVELQHLEEEVLEQARRLAQVRRSRGRAFSQMLRDLGMGELAPILSIGAVGYDVFSQARERRHLATEFGKAVAQEAARQSRRNAWFGGGSNPVERVVGSYATGAYLGSQAGGGGEHAAKYGGIGGVLGYALGGPIGGFIGSVLGGLFGKKKDTKVVAPPPESRLWRNDPEEFAIEAYLYNLRQAYGAPHVWRRTGGTSLFHIVVERGAVQVTGQDAGAGLRAANAFMGELGRAVELAQATTGAQG